MSTPSTRLLVSADESFKLGQKTEDEQRRKREEKELEELQEMVEDDVVIN